MWRRIPGVEALRRGEADAERVNRQSQKDLAAALLRHEEPAEALLRAGQLESLLPRAAVIDLELGERHLFGSGIRYR